MNEKLTQIVSCAGCGAKVGPEDLHKITGSLSHKDNELSLVGFSGNDDCGAFWIPEARRDDAEKESIILNTADFITPIVDDPFTYGQIAATNSLSDVFAMGGRALSAMNLFMWDQTHVDSQIATEILRGGLNKITESRAILLGGHTTKDVEMKYGLSVTGIVAPKHLWRNNTSKIGDALLLCKPIGSGILSTALKAGELSKSAESSMIKELTRLNMAAMLCGRDFEIHACTDITGFGLIGHLSEMCAETSALIYSNEVPIFEEVSEQVANCLIPGGTYMNKKAYEAQVKIAINLDKDLGQDIIFYDVQTSGGLLFALDKNDAHKLLDKLLKAGYEYAKIIGEITPKATHKITLG